MISAVLFDFGGVITSSPFDGFAAYEKEADLPEGLIRKINSTDPDTNAWAKFERSQITREDFLELFASEAAALGYTVDSERVLQCLSTQIRPKMVQTVERLSKIYKTAILTNNLIEVSEEDTNPGPSREHLGSVSSVVDAIIESSKIGVRKPDKAFYRIACEVLDVGPKECVFLDDLGINLKPARAIGMTTIKVVSEPQALHDLGAVLNEDLTS
ncbi:MAG: HAD-IA family hydrolase [Actinomycetota bacterium]|nr:HAD-IA family hydrolase [Actinomycetota bacterium]